MPDAPQCSGPTTNARDCPVHGPEVRQRGADEVDRLRRRVAELEAERDVHQTLVEAWQQARADMMRLCEDTPVDDPAVLAAARACRRAERALLAWPDTPEEKS